MCAEEWGVDEQAALVPQSYTAGELLQLPVETQIVPLASGKLQTRLAVGIAVMVPMKPVLKLWRTLPGNAVKPSLRRTPFSLGAWFACWIELMVTRPLQLQLSALFSFPGALPM